MLKIENEETYGWETAIRGMRNPMNSWEKSDSVFCSYYQVYDHCVLRGCKYYKDCYDDDDFHIQASDDTCIHIGPNDLDLMKRLRNAGTDDRKFMRMITVYFDVTAPLYWWKEFDTYKIGTVANSCSTMHKITAKEFTLDDFSHEHMNKYSINIIDIILRQLNYCRNAYLVEEDPELKKDAWWQLIQLLPSSYNQKRTIMLNYEVLANIYESRKWHRLDEWHDFCDWIETLPYSELITGRCDDDEDDS